MNIFIVEKECQICLIKWSINMAELFIERESIEKTIFLHLNVIVMKKIIS